MTAHRVAVVVPEDITLFELGVAAEVFGLRRPEMGLDWYDVRICTAAPGQVSAMGLLDAVVQHGPEAIDWAQTVVVPQCDTLERPAAPEVLEAIRRAYRRGARLVSYCSGAFVLAAAGVLDGRRATTHWKFTRRLVRDYPRVQVDPDVLYVDDGQVLTSAGTAAGIDLSLHIVRQDYGAKAARHISRTMVVAPHREGGQAQFVMTPVPPSSEEPDGITQTMEYALTHLEEDLDLESMARRAYMSTRHFSRRFREVSGTTPMRWLLHQRLSRARELLEDTNLSIDTIAAQTGFGSTVTLRQRFAKHLYTSPSAYRKAFRARVSPRLRQAAPSGPPAAATPGRGRARASDLRSAG
ncbi:AraC family transcriptional activator FtrA [Mumia flava]|uniref:AraC family transcriptional activator FtrA n=1 Tax=Mumia flava TaxID=1348852 RepID=A0A2M9B7C8_9ACTN|nr:helix-turn-helix domain-containing protein [Mumia flava]PJJ53817.1 AraC family transcriptional activator FtrA [Mumia flava]